MDWCRTLHGAWLALRAIQLWAPLPDNDPDGARACMRRFYALVRLSHGEPASPAKAAELEVDWWRVHRQVQYSTPGVAADDLVESVTRLYCYLFGEPEAEVRPAAVYRVRAMGLSDQWVREGCLPGSPLLPLVRAALVRAYAVAARCRAPLNGTGRTDASPARLGEQAYGERALPLCHPVRGTDHRDMRRAGPRTRLQLTAIPGLNPAGELAGMCI